MNRKCRDPVDLLLVALCAVSMLVAAPPSLYAADRGADGKYEKRTSSHFVLYQDVDIDRTSGFRGSRRFEQQVLDALENAYREVDDHLGLRPERPITVVVYDPQIFDAQYSGLFRFPAAGFYGGRVHVRGDTVVSNRLVQVLHHELVHAAFDAEAPTLPVPAWLNEGTAEWLEMRVTGQRRISGRQQAILAEAARRGQIFTLDQLSLRSFGNLGPEGARLAYWQAHAFVTFLAIEHGEQALRELIDDFIRSGNLERAVRRSFRAELAELEKQFHAQLLAASS